MAEDALIGPVRRPHNRYLELPGSIHNNEVARRLGFRGGTVAGSVHMDQFVPLLLELFGPSWFETGSLSLYFRSASTDGEPVQARAERPDRPGDTQIAVCMIEPGGTLVADGTASVGDPGVPSAVFARDLRPADPGSLRILAAFRPGESLGTLRLSPDAGRQRDIVDRGQLTEPLPWYREDSPWGGPIAAPSTVVSLLYSEILTPVKEKMGQRVGLFGAIEVRFSHGPVFLGETYDVSGEIVALSETPKTEVLWFDSWAEAGGQRVATMRMMLRSMKAASPQHYPELAGAGAGAGTGAAPARG
jgi:acyl dehydratase